MSTDDSKKPQIVRYSKETMLINSDLLPKKIIMFVKNNKGGMDRYTFISLPRDIV